MARRSRPTLSEQMTSLADTLAACPVVGPTAVGVLPRRGGVDLTLRALPGDDLLVALAGHRAPPTWDAFGVVAPARARRLHPATARPEPIRVAVLVDRCGAVADALVDQAGRPLVSGPPEGRLLDVCRRVLGLPTDPPPCPPRVWAVRAELDSLLGRASRAAPNEMPPGTSGARLAPAPDHVPPWPVLRRECAAGSRVVRGVEPSTADWMDDGMFAREALGALAPLAAAVADLGDRLAASDYRALLRDLRNELGQA